MPALHFIRPLWFWALLPYGLLLVLMIRNRLSVGDWTRVCDAELLPFLLLNKPARRRRWPQISLALAGLLSIIALAGPAWERLPAPVFRNAAALVIALDLSKSMDAEDIKPSRLIRAHYKIADILKRRKDGQTALLVYAGDAFTVTPLTDDTETISSQLSALNTDIMPSGGSNAANALEKAATLLRQAGLQQGQILLVTDGVDMDASLTAVKQLGAYKLSILGVGTAEGAPIKSAGSGFVKDVAGNIVIPKLNSSDLQKLADAGGGIMQLLSDDDSDVERLQALFEQQARAQSNVPDSHDQLMDQWLDRGPWLLWPVLPLAALAFRRGLLCFALLLLLPLPKNSYALSWRDLWQTPDQQGQQAFQSNDYAQAAQTFKNPQWKAAALYKAGKYEQALESFKDPQSADDFYNRGNALAKLGRFQEAIEAYSQAEKLNPNDKDYKANNAIAKKELKKQKEKKQASQQEQPKDGKSISNTNQSNQQPQNDQQQNNPEQARQNKGADRQGNDADSETAKGQQPQAERQNPQQSEKQTAAQVRAAEAKNDDKNKAGDTQQAASIAQKPLDETQQADEQWLKRIPDDPSGLLRRKFAYQYQQRGRKAQDEEQW